LKVSGKEQEPFDRIYMIGDNPASDIRGANRFGWESVLVKTGVWKEDDDVIHDAKYVVDDVLDGVIVALQKEGRY
jgi:ribonucleotide monophosphatase NagD (HAD superfamily)